MIYSYDGFYIESFEAGKGLWHARIMRADLSPVVIDGVLFPTLEVGFAWSDSDAAVADAKARAARGICPFLGCPFLGAGAIPYSPNGEESRSSEKARQNPEIESAKFQGV